MVGGGTLAYAKYDPEFRKLLAEYAPFTDSLIKFVFQEERSIWQNITRSLDDLKYSVITMFGGEGRKPRDIKEVPIDYKRKLLSCKCVCVCLCYTNKILTQRRRKY